MRIIKESANPRLDEVNQQIEDLLEERRQIERSHNYRGYKSDYRYQRIEKQLKQLLKKRDALEAESSNQEVVTASKLTNTIKKLTGLETIKTYSTAIRGYRPISSGNFEVVNYDSFFLVKFVGKNMTDEFVADIRKKLEDMGYQVSGDFPSSFYVEKFKSIV